MAARRSSAAATVSSSPSSGGKARTQLRPAALARYRARSAAENSGVEPHTSFVEIDTPSDNVIARPAIGAAATAARMSSARPSAEAAPPPSTRTTNSFPQKR